MSNWLERALNKIALNKQAIDKLPSAELNGEFPGFNSSAAADPSVPADPSQDPAMAAMDPSAGMAPPPIDPSMMMPPSEEKPIVWNNKYLVKTDGPEFIVELTPKIVTNDPNMMPPAGSPEMGQATADPMADTAMNPGANPKELQQWIAQQQGGGTDEEKVNGVDKPFAQNPELADADPLSQLEDGLPIEDSGDESKMNPRVKVHTKKASPEIMPGAARSNAYMPCSSCANYIAADNNCAQGLDTDKVQAAKSCSWLNSNFAPLGEKKDNNQDAREDRDTVQNDVSELSGGEAQMGGPNKFASLQAKLKKMW